MEKINQITDVHVHDTVLLHDKFTQNFFLCEVLDTSENRLILQKIRMILKTELPEHVVNNQNKSGKMVVLKEDDDGKHWVNYLFSDNPQAVMTLYTADGLRLDDNKEASKVKKLTDKQFFCLKKGDLVIEDYDNGEFRILTEVIDTNPEQSVKLKGIRFLPTGNVAEDKENRELLKQFPKTVTISNTDKYATLFSGYQILPSGETPVTNAVVSYFKTTKADIDLESGKMPINDSAEKPPKKKVLSHRLLNLASRIESIDRLESSDVVMVLQPNQSDMVLRICRAESFGGLVTLAAFAEDGRTGEAVYLESQEGTIIKLDEISLSDTYLFEINPLQGLLNLLKYECQG